MTDKNLWDHHQDENRIHLREWYFRQNLILKKIQKFLVKWWKILEIGFWDGYLLNTLSKEWYKVIGQDLSEKNIEITKNQWNNKKIQFLLWDDTGTLLVEDNSLDGFIASEVLEHMTDEGLGFCVQEIYRTLKAWGYAFITFPYKEVLNRSTHFCPNCWTWFHTWWHKQSWNDEKISTLFKDFEIVKSNRFISIGIKHYNNLLVRYICLFLNKLFVIKPDFLEFISSNYFLVLKKPTK